MEQLTRPYFDPDFPQLFAVGYDRSKEGTDPYNGRPIPVEVIGNEDYLRIGDSAFAIPPSAIKVHTVTDNEVHDLPRTPGGLVTSSGFSQKVIEVELIFSGAEEVFGLSASSDVETDALARAAQASDGSPSHYLSSPAISPRSLAALVAQFKRTPIVPIVNRMVNGAHDVWAVTLNSLVAETMLDEVGQPLPNVMRARLSLSAYEWQNLMPGIVNFDGAFIWPLFRWHWRQHFRQILPGQFSIYQPDNGTASGFPTFSRQNYFAHQQGMNAQFQFLLISREWVERLEQIDDLFAKMQTYALSDDFRVLPSDQKQTYLSGLADLLAKRQELESADEARMEPIDLGEDMVLTHMAVGMENTFAQLRASSAENPAMQHMGQGNIRLVATFHCFSDDALARLESMASRARAIVREQRYNLAAGFMGFQNEIASLFGVSSVVITDIQSASIEGFPGQYVCSIEMIDFNRHQRRLETLQNARSSANLYLSNTSDFNQDLNPIPTPEEQGPNLGEIDPRYIFWDRLAHQQANGETGARQIDKAFDATGRPTSPWFNMAYIQQAKEQIAYLELYPDLELPTYERLAMALSNGEIFEKGSSMEQLHGALQELRWIHWGGEGRFVDPDFYVDYPNSKLQSNLNVDPTIGPAAYFDTLLQAIATIGDNPIATLQVDGGLAGAAIDALWDEYPQAGFYGPRANVPAQPNDNSAPGRGHDRMHGIVNVPTVGNKVMTGLIIPTYAEERNEQGFVHVDGQRIQGTHPEGGVQNAKIAGNLTARDNYANYEDPNAFTQLGDQQVQDSASQIFGTGDASDGKAHVPEISQAIMAHHPIDIGTTVADEHGRLIGMLQQMIDHDKSGRLVQSYPSYVMQLIDEGPRMGWVKLFPNFFALQSVRGFSISTDRRDPIGTLEIEMLNVYGNLSNFQAYKLNLTAVSALTNYAGALGLGIQAIAKGQIGEAVNFWLEGLMSPLREIFPSITGLSDQISALRRKQNAAVMLKAGVRIHVRAGYGANGANLPVLFNGRIVDVGHDETCTVIAQSDGEELARLVPSADSEFNTINRPNQGASKGVRSAFMATGYEPRELICQMLNSHGEDLFDYNLGHQIWNAIKTTIYQASNGAAFFENPVGICHFGNPYLFNIWNMISGGGVESIDASAVATLPLPNKHYSNAKSLQQPRAQSFSETLFSASAASVPAIWNFAVNPLSGVRAGASALGGFLLSQANQVPANADPETKVGQFLTRIVGTGATLFGQGIQSGYGETGENVYPIYTPFDNIAKNFGTLFSKAGYDEWRANRNATDNAIIGAGAGGALMVSPVRGATDLGAAGYTAFDVLSKQNFPDLPPLTGETPHEAVGPLQRPGVYFNMYTHNKTVWDIIVAMAQAFPPYVAAVRPFEYRSTLYFGAPYWTMRYDYERVSAYDLGHFDSDQNDMLYGYPVSYKTRPFFQFHVYDSRMNLLQNSVRASDEDTYTDVIAMWYGGQGFTHVRPEPMPQHQTVDRAIMSSERKTVIVNTDFVGLDSAPSAAAIVGSGGAALAGYLVSHLAIPFTKIGINGGLNHFVAEKGMRKMTRALLRDYQKLMYQGTITVLGDPTTWPHDIMYISDDYTDIKGLAGVRRVTHDFRMDTGFTTTIEPDLLCDVKGDNYLASVWTWLGGFIGTSIIGHWAMRKLLSMGRRRANAAIFRFGLRLANKQGLVSKLLGTKAAQTLGSQKGWIGALLKSGLKLDGKYIDQYEPRWLIGNLRSMMLDGITSKWFNGSADFDSLHGTLVDALRGKGELLGQKGADMMAKQSLLAQLDKGLADVIDDGGLRNFESSLLREALLNNALSVDSISQLAKRTATEVMARQWLESYLISGASNPWSNELADLMAKKFGEDAGKWAITKGLATMGAEELAAFAREALPLAIKGFVAAQVLDPFAWIFQLVLGWLWDSISTWWDDRTSLMICPLQYRGVEMTAGIDGHSDGIILRGYEPNAEHFSLTKDELQALHDMHIMDVTPDGKRAIKMANGQNPNEVPVQSSGQSSNNGTTDENGVTVGPPAPPFSGQSKYTSAQRQAILAKHKFQGSTDYADLMDPSKTRDELIGLFDAWNKAGISVTTTCVCSDHGNDSDPNHTNHGHTNGFAVDIGYVNGESTGGTLGPNCLKAVKTALSYAHIHQIGLGGYSNPAPFAYGQLYQGILVFQDNTEAHIHFGTTQGRG